MMSSIWKASLYLSSVATLINSGCGFAVVEDSTVFCELPKERDEIRLVFLHEGISAAAKYSSEEEKMIGHKAFHQWQMLTHLSDEQKDLAGFSGELKQLVRTLNENASVEELEYYVDDERSRKLCSFQRIHYTNRDEIVSRLNNLANHNLAILLESIGGDAGRVYEEITAIQSKFKDHPHYAVQQALGNNDTAFLQPVVELMTAGSNLWHHLDLESVRAILSAVKEKHDWLRVEEGQLVVLIPVTAQCSRKIVADPKAAEFKKTLEERCFSAVALSATPEGLMLKIGNPNEPLTIRAKDPQPIDAAKEEKLIGLAGNRKALSDVLKEKPEGKSWEQYLMDQPQMVQPGIGRVLSPPTSRIWKSSDGRFEIEAALVRRQGSVVTLHRTDNGVEIQVDTTKLSQRDRDYIREQTKKTASSQ